MAFQIPDLAPAAPEIFVLAMACVTLMAEVYRRGTGQGPAYLLAQITLLGALLLTVQGGDARTVTFSGHFVRDAMGDALKVAAYVVTAGAFLYARDYLARRELLKGEFYVLGLFGVLGMMVMISGQSFLALYLGLELLSLCLYAMVAFARDDAAASEAAMKYFVLGAIASGMLLYGMSMIYGATGSLELAEVARRIAAGEGDTVLAFGLAFVLVGLAFKFGAVPFHMWIPDVYHGAPTAVTLYLGSAPKLAAFAMTVRILVEGLGDMLPQWQQMLVILSVLSMAVGNVVAIAQTNLKRMLAYSTISHVGFILLGILAGSRVGYAAAMFYTVTYALMAAAAFGIITLLARKGFEADRIDDFKGLNARSPWVAALTLLVMFSLAGVPPLVGFYAKLTVLRAVIDAGMLWLAVVAVLFSVVGAFYYLRVVKVMYFDAPEGEETGPVQAAGDARLLVSANALALLVLGIVPGGLMGVCLAAFGG
ncbi:NADH-quinone oxidoreductase subunit NuoN [Inmirania thermothiophila]|uniref:NADH-quinone oxidoreductase subunit N n=1 Tax=Inmirania thermothiophila TaxID=1750597 RepID=A0A3N1Y0A7_9GAMM|nr:NADH-quinone oxidoreductase subunit NuoN [Inmirania thermothiophila]ROR32284.1 NADH dehydrogenase subunit N [Inmirania thermothiophila]